MRIHRRLTLAALAATLSIGLAVGAASAGKLSFSISRFRITWETLRFQTEGGIINPGVECPVTFEGSPIQGPSRRLPEP